jgi:Cu-processing system permease protein
MRSVWSIFKFVAIDNFKSAWSLGYALFIAASTFGLIYFTGSFSRAVVSLMNIVILIVPLVSCLMMAMYYFNKSDFLTLLLAQPIRREHAFLGMYFGVLIPLNAALIIGLGLGFIGGLQQGADLQPLLLLLVVGLLLSGIFSAVALFICTVTRDRLRGIGIALVLWLFMAVIYDGLMLAYFIVFAEYPIEQHAIVFSLLNPIDLGRIMVMLHLDISALLGYSGAVFQKFFGSTGGAVSAALAMCVWWIAPLLLVLRAARKKDF